LNSQILSQNQPLDLAEQGFSALQKSVGTQRRATAFDGSTDVARRAQRKMRLRKHAQKNPQFRDFSAR
jgi:hypothetical protein